MRSKNFACLPKLAISVAAVIASGCGGGGAPTTPSTNNPIVSVEQTIEGTATKGPLDKASVSAFRVSGGVKGSLLAQTLSDKGRYVLKFNDYTGPVLVEAEGVANTVMADEATGTTLPATGLLFRAAFVLPTLSTAQKAVVHLNPFSSSAAKDATTKAGGLTLDNIEKANKDLRESMGFDPVGVEPTFDANNKPTNKAAVVLAALSQLAKDESITDCVKPTPSERIKCVVDKIVAAPIGELKVPELQASIDLVASQSNIEPPKIGLPTNTPITSASAIGQAKALLATIRSNAKALDASDISLQTEFTALQDSVDQNAAPVVDSTLEMLRTTEFGVQLLEDARNGVPVYAKNRTGTQYGAGCTVYTDNTFATVATSATNAITAACTSYAALNVNQFDSLTNMLNTWRWRHRIFVAPKATPVGSYEVKTTARREYGSIESNRFVQTNLGTTNQGRPNPVASYPTYVVQRGEEGIAEFSKTVSNGNITALRLSGSIAPSLVYAGIGQSVLIDGGRGRRHEVGIDFAKTVSNGVEKYTLSSDGFIKLFSSNGTETVFVSSISLGKDSVVEAPVDLNARNGTEKFDIRIDYQAGNSAVRGRLAASDAKWDKSNTVYIPTKATFAGSLERRENATSPFKEFVRGNVVAEVLDFSNFSSNLPRSASNPQKSKGTSELVVSIPNRPGLTLSFTLNIGGENVDGGTKTLTGKYAQGSVVVLFDSDNKATASDTDDILTLTSSEGIKLEIKANTNLYPLTKNNVNLGTYNRDTQRISYADNTFEQF